MGKAEGDSAGAVEGRGKKGRCSALLLLIGTGGEHDVDVDGIVARELREEKEANVEGGKKEWGVFCLLSVLLHSVHKQSR